MWSGVYIHVVGNIRKVLSFLLQILSRRRSEERKVMMNLAMEQRKRKGIREEAEETARGYGDQ